MRKLVILVVSILFCCSICGCTFFRKIKVENELKKLIGQKVSFPKEMNATVMQKDTACADMLHSKKIKILVIGDTAACTPCKMELGGWQYRMEEIDTMRVKPILLLLLLPKICLR